MARVAAQVRNPLSGRNIRRPQHSFNIRYQPYQIQPFLIAPVLPGETMKNLLLQARVVSKPVRNPLIGWWNEYYFFYVKHRDLPERDEFVDMALDPSWTADNVDTASADVKTYFAGNGINWTQKCLDRVVETYFRHEGETGATLDGMPIAAIGGANWMDSLVLDTDWVNDVDVGIPEVADVDPVTGGSQPGMLASQIDLALQQYELLQSYGLVTQSYEDWLATFGVRKPREEQHEPELIRFVRQWTYPTNTIDPSDGSPSSALSWSISERADKDRFCREPGFLFGVTVTRPKVYLKGQVGSAVWAMRNAVTWLPAVMRHDWRASMTKIAQASGPLTGITDDYWFDVKDLLIYGDQFINYALTATDANLMDLPVDGTGQRRFALEADIDDLFVGESGGTIDADGIVTLAIAGAQVDTSPTGGVVVG